MEPWKKTMTETFEYFRTLRHELQVRIAERAMVHLAEAAMDELIDGMAIPETGEAFQVNAVRVLTGILLLLEDEVTSWFSSAPC